MGGFISQQFKKAIDKSKKIILDKFIYSIGIRHIGQENAKTIAAFFVSIKEFSKIYDIKIRRDYVKKFERTGWHWRNQTISINNFFSNNKNVKIIKNLTKQLSIENYLVENREENFLIKN